MPAVTWEADRPSGGKAELPLWEEMGGAGRGGASLIGRVRRSLFRERGASAQGGEGRSFLLGWGRAGLLPSGRGGTSSVGRGKEEHLPWEGRGFLCGRGEALPASLDPSTAHGTLRTSRPATGLAAARPPN